MPKRGPTFEATIAGLARITERALEGQGLTIQKYRVLAYLSWKPMSPSELAEQLFVKPPVTSRIVEGLAQRGYVKRMVDTRDGRRTILTVTASGAAALRRAHVAINEGVEEVGALLDAAERRAAFHGLDLWREAFRRYMERSHKDSVARRGQRA